VAGETARLKIEARVGQRLVAPHNATWASSDTTVAVVQHGVVTGHEPGISFITARIGASEAMAEIEVVER